VTERVNGFLNPATSDTYQVDRALDAFRNGGLFARAPAKARSRWCCPTPMRFRVRGRGRGAGRHRLPLHLSPSSLRDGARHRQSCCRSANLFVLLAAAGLLVTFGPPGRGQHGVELHLMPTKGIPCPSSAMALLAARLRALDRHVAGADAPARRAGEDNERPRPDLLTAGGTGGHMFPAEALAAALLSAAGASCS